MVRSNEVAGPKPKNDVYSHPAIAQNLPFPAFGAVAQLIERVVRNDEVVGLIPICSTSLVLDGVDIVSTIHDVDAETLRSDIRRNMKQVTHYQ